MNKVLLAIAGIVCLFIGGGAAYVLQTRSEYTSSDSDVPTVTPEPTPKPLLAFTFDALSQRTYQASTITLEEKLNEESEEEDGFESHLFSFTSDGKKVTGMLNIPLTPFSHKMPVVIMLRGYVDQSMYRTGIGTERAAGFFAKNGYITIAPDFLGYGGSDMPENDVWWERFNNPVVVLNLLESIKTLPQADANKIAIWAHSNGGQIALSVLEITQKPIPTTLWAPVTKPFPYSILYFTDEFEDEGKALRAEISRLEKDYDVYDFCITKHLDRIKAPLQLHQGTADDAVPVEWSNEFAQKMEELEIDMEYFVYPGADHHMVGNWDTVVERDLKFFKKALEEEK
ncbi:MAG: alpha/beta hydrolase family protein [Patescibacteria group bacterium]|jgi:dipeptidyl aminopeptidase/acylaminoacyl peptidase